MRTALVGATLIDGTGRPPRAATTLVLDGDVILEVGREREFGPDTRVVDLQGATVLPGLIDCHMHLAPWGMRLIQHQQEPLMLLAARTVQALRATLAAGFTTVRDMGGLDVGFRQAVDAGLIPGPRILASLVLLSPTNGMVDATTAQGLASPPVPGMPTPNCDGPDQARAKVREVLRAGADLIKIATTGGVSSPRIGPHQQVFTRAEVDAIVEEAHMAGVPVACHAHGGPGLAMAIRAGVDSIEHGAYLDNELAREMADRGTWLVPTLTIVEFRRTRTSGAERAKAEAVHATHARALAAAMRAGVRIALGTDTGAFGYGGNAQEFELLVEAGMPVDQAIQAGTGCAAECLGLGDQVGTIKPGKQADLVVVDGDPLADLTVLRGPERLVGVWKAGQLVAGRLTEPAPSAAR